ncbi:MAG: hypothetical protein LBC56_06595 [Oscillospiraceae bacterium]|nr:hypothetical protein [Oscillospiraceae bacterium]
MTFSLVFILALIGFAIGLGLLIFGLVSGGGRQAKIAFVVVGGVLMLLPGLMILFLLAPYFFKIGNSL